MSEKPYIEVMADYEHAKREVLSVIEKKYPIGTWWNVMVRHGQKTPSVMQVCSYPSHRVGAIRFSKKKAGKYARDWEKVRKDLYPSQILGQTTNPEGVRP